MKEAQINTLIVDDEPIIRNGIKNILDWKKAGVDGIYTAGSGEEALELAREVNIDILVTDIRMGTMTGLDLIREFKKDNPRLKSIIITAYDDFDYVQEGLRLHADDFLIKPIDENEIFEKIRELAEQAYDERRSRNEELLSRRVLGSKSQQKSEKLMRELLREKENASRKVGEIREIYEQYEEQEVRLLMLHSFQDQPFSEEDLQFYRYSIFDFCLNNIDCVEKGISFHDEKGYICIAYFCEEETPEDVVSIQDFMNLLCTELEVRAEIAVGQRVHSLEELAASYHDAYVQVQENLISTAAYGKNLLFQESSDKERLYWDVISEIERYILVETENPERIQHIFDTYCRMVEAYDVPDETVRLSSYKLLTMLYYGKAGAKDTPLNIGEYLQTISNAGREEILRITNEIFGSICQYQPEESSLAIEKTLAYIDDHLNEKLSVTELANLQYLSPAHFSRMFKKATGEGCNEYIVRRKMEKAAFLLKTTHLKISEIASQIGYEDSNYFSLSFKKYFGKNPTEYRMG